MSRRHQTASALAALFALAMVAGPAGAQQGEQLGPVAQAAAQRGVRTCLDAIDRLAKSLSANRDLGAYLFNRVEDPDSSLVSISMELTPSPSGGPFYLSATFVPGAAGGCQVMLESTMHWTSACAPVGLAYPGFQAAGQLLGDIKILAAAGTERLFLLPTPSGCISIEKSVYF